MENLLHQILAELQLIKSDLNQLNQNQQRLEINQNQMSLQINAIYQSIVQLEEGQPKDIFAILHTIHNNILNKDAEISALNKRVFRIESEIERINRQ